MSRTQTQQCSRCPYEETWYDKQDVSYNFDVCKYCELTFCQECLIEHLKDD